MILVIFTTQYQSAKFLNFYTLKVESVYEMFAESKKTDENLIFEFSKLFFPADCGVNGKSDDMGS